MMFEDKDKLVKDIFDHLRNLFISTTVIGLAVLVAGTGFSADDCFQFGVGLVTIFVGILLLAINSLHGVSKFQDNMPTWAAIVFVLIYYPIIFQVGKVAWMQAAGL